MNDELTVCPECAERAVVHTAGPLPPGSVSIDRRAVCQSCDWTGWDPVTPAHRDDVPLWDCPCLECTRLDYSASDTDLTIGEWRAEHWPEHWPC